MNRNRLLKFRVQATEVKTVAERLALLKKKFWERKSLLLVRFGGFLFRLWLFGLVKLSLVPFCKLNQLFGKFRMIRNHVVFFVRIILQVEQRELDGFLAIDCIHAVVPLGLNHPVGMRQMKFPASVSADDGFQLVFGGNRIIFVRILSVGISFDQSPNITAIDFIFRQRRTGQVAECWQEVGGVEGQVGRGTRFDLSWKLDDAGQEKANVAGG